MDTRFLESYLVVVESSSLAEAARQLNLTPAALGLRIRALENEIGFPLVMRSGRTVKPTAAGLTLAARAKGFLHELRDLKMIGHEETLSGELRLGVAVSAVSGILCRILLAFAQKYPDVDISVAKGSSADLYRRLTNSDLDVALVFEPQFELPKTFGWESIRREHYIVLAPMALAGSDPHELLRTKPFIRYDRTLWSGQLADNYLSRMRIQPRERLELDSLEAIAVLVDQGLGVSLVPEWSKPWPEGIKVAKLPLPGEAPVRDLGVLWPRSSPRSRMIHALLREAVTT
jgi:DNA-binding transcriptional LysR family regulator